MKIRNKQQEKTALIRIFPFALFRKPFLCYNAFDQRIKGDAMKISYKMILLFSIALILAVSILTSFATDISLREFIAFNAVRFRNIGETVLNRLEQQKGMMDLLVDELMDNASFMAALNQFVRDESDDRKVGQAAENMVAQMLYASPLVDMFYRVSIYTREGDFITSRFDKDSDLESGTEQAQSIISALPWLDAVDAAPAQGLILAPHIDFLSSRTDRIWFSVVKGALYHGKQIGYIQVSLAYAELDETMSAMDEESILVKAVFDDGAVLYGGAENPAVYPDTLEPNRLLDWANEALGARQKVMRLRSERLGLNLYVAQDRAVMEQREREVRWRNLRTAVLIILPTLAIIVVISLRLTRSIRLLTKKVNQIPADQTLHAVSAEAFSHTVTAPDDQEIHELEKVLNHLMLRLRESTLNELASREGTLQAQLSALQTQINPHFIYNTLNIISAKSMESGNLDVIEICDQFAQMLRYSTDTRSRTATMADEIENVRNYLLLAKARYEDNLEFTIDIPEHLSDISVPKLTLQPLVENALNHGYDGQNQKRLLSVRGWIENGQLTLEIRDNGTGFSEEKLADLQRQLQDITSDSASIQEAEGHIGLLNTCLRLHYYSHGAMRMSIRNDHGAVVTLTMPCKQN